MSKVYEIISEEIIDRLEEAIETGDVAPWQKGWVAGTINHYTGREYRGINLLTLEPGEYLTFNQIKKLQSLKKNKDKKIKLKKGSKSKKVVFWHWFKVKNKNVSEEEALDEEDFKVFAKPYYSNVFNIEDVEGLEPRLKFREEKETNYVQEIEDAIKDYSEREGVSIEESKGGGSAYYNLATDSITIPSRVQFKNDREFYHTLFHELIHSSGAENRLNRFSLADGSAIFGSASYSKEELVAEIGANMLMAHFGLELEDGDVDNSISYLRGWLSKIKDDMKLVVHASQQAQKAVEYILDIENSYEDINKQ